MRWPHQRPGCTRNVSPYILRFASRCTESDCASLMSTTKCAKIKMRLSLCSLCYAIWSLSCNSLRLNNSQHLVHVSTAHRSPLMRSYSSFSVLVYYPCFAQLRRKVGSHADESVPIGGYSCPSCSIRGPHVHHCSEGTFDMTPATCLPQPHHVVLSDIRQQLQGMKALNELIDLRHESQAAFLHILKSFKLCLIMG